MTKSILINVRPENAVNILNGKKTLELRKDVPKDFVGWVYMYVAKNQSLYLSYEFNKYFIEKTPSTNIRATSNNVLLLSGKVVARWWHDEFRTYTDGSNCTNNENGYECEYEYMYALCELQDELKKLCLTCDEVEDYGNGKVLYAWHIKKLEVFDKPMGLSEFYKINTDPYTIKNGHTYGYVTPIKQTFILTKAPSTWKYVWTS